RPAGRAVVVGLGSVSRVQGGLPAGGKKRSFSDILGIRPATGENPFMTVPCKERYFEDFRPGEVIEFGDYLVTEEEIVEFATRYDPQPFHVDRKAAGESIYEGLIASGWMTGCIM